jgi:hypothetical protein
MAQDHRKTRARTRETMVYARHALAATGRLGVIFPSGPSCQRRGCGCMNGPG